MSMFCYQCEQTAHGTGCTNFGICGKDPDTAALQDLVVHAAKGISMLAHRARQLGVKNHNLDVITLEALFATVTNVNFDPHRLKEMLHRQANALMQANELYEQACKQTNQEPESLNGPTQWVPAESLDGLINQGMEVSVKRRKQQQGEDVTGLEELILYGIKGLAAYAYHALILNQEDDSVYAFIHEGLACIGQTDHSIDHLFTMAMKVGEINLKVLKMLDNVHTTTYGHPVPTKVRTQPVKGKAILVSGHDLKDLEELLKQTQGQGINIYTHGEMLPAHGYPELKKYKHLAGNFGGAWMLQQSEFPKFPGAILMTTNCIQKPRESYQERLFTCGLVAWPDVTHIENHEFGPVIKAALTAEGFTEDGPDEKILVGFAHNAVLGVADKVIDAIKAGDLNHIFLIGGCDGAETGRNYFTDFAEAVPDDSAILTLGCGKYRFNKLEFGDIGGIPRLLDMGQCNDAYSAIKVAMALAEAFETDVNSLPLSMIISWFEQKAVCILLTLLYLGIQDIHLGPALPAFISPAVLEVLVEKFNIKPITNVKDDLSGIMAQNVS